MNTIYESNSTGRPVTSNGKIIKTNNNRRIIYNNPNGTHALYRNNNLKLLNINPSDSSKNIKQHEFKNDKEKKPQRSRHRRPKLEKNARATP